VAAASFESELKQSVQDLAETALIWPENKPGIRARVLRRYPYTLLYRVQDDEVLLVAVAHQKRRPGYWHERR